MPYSPMELAEAFLKTGELDDALEAINQQLEDNPADDEARRLRIQIQMRLLPPAQYSNLHDDFDALAKKTVDDWQLKSVIAERAGDLNAAIAAIHEARKLSPENERLSERLLDLLLASESYDDALTLVRAQEQSWRWLEREGDVLVLQGNDMLATARYGLVLSHLSDFEGKMQADYLQALKTRVMLARAHAYRRLGHTDTAKEHYLAAKEFFGEDVTIQFNLGLIAEMEGNHDEALKLCKDALSKASQALKDNMAESLDADAIFETLKLELGL